MEGVLEGVTLCAVESTLTDFSALSNGLHFVSRITVDAIELRIITHASVTENV